MMAASCSCGFTELADENLTDHLLQVFEPDEHQGNGAVVHQEGDRLTCLCGLPATTPEELDAHFLQVFTPADAIGRDGHKHEC